MCDSSRALLNSIALVFKSRSLSDYIELSFTNAKNLRTWKPNTYIRLDTAHFIHAVSCWKCWKSVSHKNVKSFYLYCIVLLIECHRWEDFERSLILILIVCSTEFEDTVISYNNEYLTPLDARKELENIIGNKKSKILYHDIEEKIKTMNFDVEKSTILNDPEQKSQ